MELKGLKVNFLGDSITQGHGTSAPDKIYHALLKEKYGLAEARNYGIGGTRIAKQHNPTNEVWDQDFCKRCLEMDPDADLIVVFGGTNDFGHGDAPLGSFTDRMPNTYYGALHYLYTTLMEKYPKAQIVVMTPLHRISEDNPKGDGYKAYDFAPLSRYVEIIKEVTEYYSIPTLDLWSVSGIQPKVEVIRQRYCPDGLHPNDAGHELIASRLAGFLKTL